MHNPLVPETLDGWSLLHLMCKVRWDRVRELSDTALHDLANDATQALTVPSDDGATAWVQLLGHKGDLMVIGFRRGFDALAQMQLALAHTRLHDLLEITTSYVSVVELGLYDMTGKLHAQLGQKFKPGSDEFERAFDVEMVTQQERMMNRLFTRVPPGRHVCFYPMDKKRGEKENWYLEPFARRAAMMREHGMIGRHYAGRVTQIISGSIGFDDWEWGVDLFADDPLIFKKLIYEMRFDEASARFAVFGPFYIGLQFSPVHLGKLLSGHVPSLE
jgi:chlorite dismutase